LEVGHTRVTGNFIARAAVKWNANKDAVTTFSFSLKKNIDWPISNFFGTLVWPPIKHLFGPSVAI
jgi:hypothetical protein